MYTQQDLDTEIKITAFVVAVMAFAAGAVTYFIALDIGPLWAVLAALIGLGYTLLLSHLRAKFERPEPYPPRPILARPAQTQQPEYVYLAQRNLDGLYKIGRSIDPARRAKDLSQPGAKVSLLLVWPVTNAGSAERKALAMTAQYDPEKRTEWRQMTDSQALDFIRKFSSSQYP